ncbi:MAG: type III secretion system translocon subunit SctE [Parashewanella sp.]
MSSINVNHKKADRLPSTNDAGAAEAALPPQKAAIPDWSHSKHLLFDQVSRRGGLVSHREADRSLKRMLQKLGQKDAPVLAHVERASMKSMVLMATNLSINTFSATAEATVKASKIMTDTQAFLRDKKVHELQKQMQQQIQQKNDARKANIFINVFDWIIAAAETIYGIFKLVEGVAEAVASLGCDPNAYLSIVAGGAYICAGTAGIVKAAAETAKLCGADPKICDQVAKIAGYVQLGFEMVTLATDIIGGGLALDAAHGAVDAIKAGVSAAAPDIAEGVNEAIAKGAEEGGMEMINLAKDEAKLSVKELAEQVSKEVGENVGEDMADKLSGSLKKAAKKTTNKALKYFFQRSVTKTSEAIGKDAIQQITKKAIEEAADEAIKKGVQVTAKDISKAVIKKASRRVAWQVTKLTAKVGIRSVQGMTQGASMMSRGAIAAIKGHTEAVISELIIKEEFNEYVYDWYERSKDTVHKTAKELVQKESTALQGATATITQTGSIQARIAGSIAG